MGVPGPRTAVLLLGLGLVLAGCGGDGVDIPDMGVDVVGPSDPGPSDTPPNDPGGPRDLGVGDIDPVDATAEIGDPGVGDADLPLQDIASDVVEPPVNFRVHDLTNVGNVRALWAAPDGAIWAVGDDGLVLRSTGGDFLPAPIPPSRAHLFGVTGADQAVFVAGARGTAWRLDVSGWTDLESPVEVDLMAVGAVSAEDVFFVGREGTILNFKDGTWHTQTTGITSDLFGISASSAGGVHVVGAFGGLLQRDGANWVRAQIAGPGVTLRSIWRAPDGRMVAVGSGGTVVLYDGLSWKQQLTTETVSPARTLYSVTGLDGQDIVAVGDRGAVVQHDDGKWRMVTVAGPYNALADLRAVTAAAASEGSHRMVAVGLDSAAIERFGTSWNDRILGLTGSLHGVDVRSDGGVVAVGEDGLVLDVRDGRVGSRIVPTDADLHAVSGRYAVGDRGTLLDLGLDPVAAIPTGTDADLTDVWSDEDGAWITSVDGTLFRLDPDGVRVEVRRGVVLTSVCAAGEARWVGGVDGRLEMRDGQGQRLLPTDTGATIRDCVPSEDRVVVVGDHGLALDCGAGDCVRLFEDPATFLYGVHRHQDRTVAAGWAGTVLVRVGDGPFEPLDTGTYRVFRDVVALPDGREWFFVGLDGTLATWIPGEAP